MKINNKKLPLLGMIMLPLLVLTSTLNALTVTKTQSVTVGDIDGTANYGVALDSVDFTNAFYTGATITKVTSSIVWTKTDGTTCAGPLTGNAYHNETNFRLDSPVRNVILASPNTWSGGTDIGDVNTTFDQSATTSPSGTPVNGTFKPNSGNLGDFNGDNAEGIWHISAGDTASNDPLCVHSYAVSITVADDTDGDGVVDDVDVDDDNDGILDKTECSNVAFTDGFDTITGLNEGNNIGIDISALWNHTGTSNVVKVPVSGGYVGGPAVDARGIAGNYYDVTGTSVDGGGYVYHTFTLTDATTIYYGGSFSARDGNTGNGRVFITQGTTYTDPVVSTSATVTSSDNTAWQHLEQETAVLPAGTYTFVAYLHDNFNFDEGFVRSCEDTDGDGVLNRFDLDSDNDGIPDTVEAQTTVGFLPIQSPPVVDANGIPTEFAPQGINISIDTDSDGVFDYLDNDSDNDQVLDCIEGIDITSPPKVCPIDNSTVGINGLTSWAESADDYMNVLGIISDPLADMHDYKIGDNEVSYRETSPCGNELVWELKANQWKTISAPCLVDDDIMTVFDTFGNLGAYGDSGKWVMYEQADFTGNRSTGYSIMQTTDTMNVGVGYWIITDDDVTVTINENDLPGGVSASTKITATNHSIISPNFDEVLRTSSLLTSDKVQKVLFGNPFHGAFHVDDLFLSVDVNVNFFPLGSSDVNATIYDTIYVYDHVGTDTSNYVAKNFATPGFGDTIEKGIGFWLGIKAIGFGSFYGLDIPYVKVK